MYLFSDEGKELLTELRAEMLGALEAKFEFLEALLKENDWSFVIKLHALIEAVTTQIILSNVDDERLRATIERLPLSDDEIGKLRIAKDLGLYTKSQRAFIRRMSMVRNKIVHNLENLDFRFSEYVTGLDSNAKDSWINAICWFVEGKDSDGYWRKASIETPQLAVWLSGFMLVSLSLVSENELIGKRRIQEKAIATSTELLKQLLGVKK